MVIVQPLKRTKEQISRQSSTLQYNVQYNSIKARVSKKGFLAIHGLGECRVRSAIQKVSPTGTPTTDKWGRHTLHNKIVGREAALVREHIKLLTAMFSHYSRSNTPHKRCLDSILTIRKLYNMYISWKTNNHPHERRVTFYYYSNIFTSEFNISFKTPRTAQLVTPSTLPSKIMKTMSQK